MPYSTIIAVDAQLLNSGVITIPDLKAWERLDSLVFIIGSSSARWRRVCDSDAYSCLEMISRNHNVVGSRLFITNTDVRVPGWNVVNVNKLSCLNIGCGDKPFYGCVNIDKRLLPTVDLVVDVESQGLPFPNEFFDVVYMIDVLEHISWRKTINVVDEVWRVLKPGGRFIIRVPNIERIAEMVLRRDYPKIVHPDIGEFHEWQLISYYLFGGQENPEDFHKAGFTESAIRELLSMVGFEVTQVLKAKDPSIHPNMLVVGVKAVRS